MNAVENEINICNIYSVLCVVLSYVSAVFALLCVYSFCLVDIWLHDAM